MPSDKNAAIKRQKDLMKVIAVPGKRADEEVPMFQRAAPVSNGSDEYEFEIVWSVGARVRRYDWFRGRWFLEELSMDPAHIRMDRFASGRANVLNSHQAWDLSNVLGVIRSAELKNGEGTARIAMSKRPDVADVVSDMRDGIIGNVSVGYDVHKFEMLEPDRAGELWVYRATDWEPMEVSLVPIGADADAGVRDAEDPRWKRCEFIESAIEPQSTKESTMDVFTVARGLGVQYPDDADAQAVRGLLVKRFDLTDQASDEEIVQAAVRAAKPDAIELARKEGERAARVRAAEILAFSRRHRMPEDMTERAITEGWSQERCANEILELRAAEGDRTAPIPGAIRTGGEAEAQAVAESVLARYFGIK